MVTPGTKLGPYEIVALIGAGGMGEVYRARDPRLGREVAIKVLPAEFASDPERLRRFELEAHAVAALSHPNVLAVYDVGTHEGSPYLVTELLEGETLRERLRTGDLTVRRAVEFAVQVAQGLAAAHEKGIIHRDLKPANVFVTKDAHVKILDFGIAKLAPQRLAEPGQAATVVEVTETGTALGTVGYMSPEQVRGQSVDHRTDIFSFGCVLYELLSGRRAFSGDTAADTISAILAKDPLPLIGPRSEVPVALQGIVNRCLEKNPDDRFQSTRDLGFALEAEAGALLAPPAPKTAEPSPKRAAAGLGRFARPYVLVPVAVLVVVAAVLGPGIYKRRAKVAWARNQAIPEIMRLADKQEFWQAFLLARNVDAVLPGDPLLAKLWPQFAAEIIWQVKPEGAEIHARSKKDPAGDWVDLGRASGKPVWTPIGCMAYKVEHPGYEAHTFAMSLLYGKGILPLSLSAIDGSPSGMVRVDPPTAEAVVHLNFLNYEAGPPSAVLGSFLIDTHEVTNRQFKEFMDAGGYRRPELWRHELVRGGQVIPWEQAMAMFVDATGRPGPATWELGTYPEGKADFPVTGVSWYEAAAYAETVGKRLPTVYHWRTASGAANSGCFIIGSNFSGRLAPVGSYRESLNLRGLYDMAGNAREWCSNASGEERVTLGGAYDSPAYTFFDTDLRIPFDRSPTNGFRCIKLLTPASLPADLEGPIAQRAPDWSREVPFPDAVWQTWLSFLSYQKQPLDAKVELVDDSPQYWRTEKVSFDAAYGGERMIAYLLLPRNVPPPWQAVVFWPGALAARSTSTENGQNLSDSQVWGYLVKDGRAVLYPVLKGTYERGGGRPAARTASMETWVMRAKDISRSLDYLESRGDIAKDRLAFLGFSFGAYGGLLPCATEARFKVGILQSGGLRFSENLGWAHRVRIPIQMVNGRYDSLFLYRTNQVPLFRALATAEKDKRHVVFETGHDLNGVEKEVIKANLEWLDRYVGPVKR